MSNADKPEIPIDINIRLTWLNIPKGKAIWQSSWRERTCP